MKKSLLTAMLAAVLTLALAAPALAQVRLDLIREPSAYDEDHYYLRETRREYSDGAWEVSTYDAAGHITRHENSWGGWYIYTYDQAGNQTRYETSAGTWSVNIYDAAGRLLREENSSGGWTSYAYDGAGNIIRHETSAGVWGIYTYDAAGNLTRFENSEGYWFAYSYNQAGHVISYEGDGGYRETSTYDVAGNLTRTEDNFGNWYNYSYDAAGNEIRHEASDGYRCETTYDGTGNVLRIAYTGGDWDGEWYAYAYDQAGRLVRCDDYDGAWRTYTYDQAGRLLRMDLSNGGWETYSYDAAGNNIRAENSAGYVSIFTYAPRTHSQAFKDVPVAAFYYESVLWAVEEKITTGTTATTFSPNSTCTQAQIVTFLWRAAGETEPKGKNPYSDKSVSAEQYYYKALLWAYEQGVVTDSFLNPAAPCARKDVALYLWRLAGSPTATDAGFADVAADAPYAQAVAWAAEQGVTTGTTATTFSPDSTCTRGQIVTFLYRALAGE